MTGKGIKTLRGEKIKDNPVPSLDDRVLEALMILDNGIYNGLSPEDIRKVKKVLNDIPNGVETNKVQPNCKYIKREGESCTKNNQCLYPFCN